MTANESNEGPVGTLLSQPILIPLDGSDVAEGILPYVSQIAKKEDNPLVLLSVVDDDAIEYPSSILISPSSSHPEVGITYRKQIEETARSHALDKLNGIADSLREEGLAVEARATLGRPSEEILRVAEEEGCRLIAMSTHGRNAIARGILGSVTDRVLHSSSTPVLTITPERAENFRNGRGETLKTILVPLDGSELAERALPYAEELARFLSLDVLLVRVVSFHPAFHTEFGARLADLGEAVVEESAQYLSGVSKQLEDAGLTVQTRVLRGTAARVLLEVARDTPGSLIAITTNARSGLSRWVMGSVAEALARGSGDPVLIVRPSS